MFSISSEELRGETNNVFVRSDAFLRTEGHNFQERL